jgi:hypothetical protein
MEAYDKFKNPTQEIDVDAEDKFSEITAFDLSLLQKAITTVADGVTNNIFNKIKKEIDTDEKYNQHRVDIFNSKATIRGIMEWYASTRFSEERKSLYNKVGNAAKIKVLEDYMQARRDLKLLFLLNHIQTSPPFLKHTMNEFSNQASVLNAYLKHITKGSPILIENADIKIQRVVTYLRKRTGLDIVDLTTIDFIKHAQEIAEQSLIDNPVAGGNVAAAVPIAVASVPPVEKKMKNVDSGDDSDSDSAYNGESSSDEYSESSSDEEEDHSESSSDEEEKYPDTPADNIDLYKTNFQNLLSDDTISKFLTLQLLTHIDRLSVGQVLSVCKSPLFYKPIEASYNADQLARFYQFAYALYNLCLFDPTLMNHPWSELKAKNPFMDNLIGRFPANQKLLHRFDNDEYWWFNTDTLYVCINDALLAIMKPVQPVHAGTFVQNDYTELKPIPSHSYESDLRASDLRALSIAQEQQIKDMEYQMMTYTKTSNTLLKHEKDKNRNSQRIIEDMRNVNLAYAPAYAERTQNAAQQISQLREILSQINKKPGKPSGVNDAAGIKIGNEVLALRDEIKNKRLLIKGNISVIARVRPQVPPHKLSNGKMSIGDLDSTYATVTERGITLDKKPTRAYDDKYKTVFDFQQVFRCTEDNPMIQEVYDEFSFFISALKAKRDCLLFAFGQTGGGKSTLMEGMGKGQPGIYERFLTEVFGGKLKEKFDKVRLSALEIKPGSYTRDEKPTDGSNKSIKVKTKTFGRDMLKLNDSNSGYLVNDDTIKPYVRYKDAKLNGGLLTLDEVELKSVQEFKRKFKDISAVRQTESTDGNVTSSRSHLILHLNLYDKDGKVTVLTMVDLAGYERDPSKADTEKRKESKAINYSLTRLKEAMHNYNGKAKKGYVVSENVFSSGHDAAMFEPHLVRHLSPLLKAGGGRLAFVLALSIWNSSKGYKDGEDRHLSAATESLNIASNFQEQKSVNTTDRAQLQVELDALITKNYTPNMEPFVVKNLDRWLSEWTPPTNPPTEIPIWLDQSIHGFLNDIKDANAYTKEKLVNLVDGTPNETPYGDLRNNQEDLYNVITESIDAQIDDQLFNEFYQEYNKQGTTATSPPIFNLFGRDEKQSNENFIQFITETTNNHADDYESKIATELGYETPSMYIVKRQTIQTLVVRISRMKKCFKRKVTAVVKFFKEHMSDIKGKVIGDLSDKLTEIIAQFDAYTNEYYKSYDNLLDIKQSFNIIDNIMNKCPVDINSNYKAVMRTVPESMFVVNNKLSPQSTAFERETQEQLNLLAQSILTTQAKALGKQNEAMHTVTDALLDQVRKEQELEEQLAKQNEELCALQVKWEVLRATALNNNDDQKSAVPPEISSSGDTSMSSKLSGVRRPAEPHPSSTQPEPKKSKGGDSLSTATQQSDTSMGMTDDAALSHDTSVGMTDPSSKVADATFLSELQGIYQQNYSQTRIKSETARYVEMRRIFRVYKSNHVPSSTHASLQGLIQLIEQNEEWRAIRTLTATPVVDINKYRKLVAFLDKIDNSIKVATDVEAKRKQFKLIFTALQKHANDADTFLTSLRKARQDENKSTDDIIRDMTVFTELNRVLALLYDGKIATSADQNLQNLIDLITNGQAVKKSGINLQQTIDDYNLLIQFFNNFHDDINAVVGIQNKIDVFKEQVAIIRDGPKDPISTAQLQKLEAAAFKTLDEGDSDKGLYDHEQNNFMTWVGAEVKYGDVSTDVATKVYAYDDNVAKYIQSLRKRLVEAYTYHKILLAAQPGGDVSKAYKELLSVHKQLQTTSNITLEVEQRKVSSVENELINYKNQVAVEQQKATNELINYKNQVAVEQQKATNELINYQNQAAGIQNNYNVLLNEIDTVWENFDANFIAPAPTSDLLFPSTKRRIEVIMKAGSDLRVALEKANLQTNINWNALELKNKELNACLLDIQNCYDAIPVNYKVTTQAQSVLNFIKTTKGNDINSTEKNAIIADFNNQIQALNNDKNQFYQFIQQIAFAVDKSTPTFVGQNLVDHLIHLIKNPTQHTPMIVDAINTPADTKLINTFLDDLHIPAGELDIRLKALRKKLNHYKKKGSKETSSEEVVLLKSQLERAESEISRLRSQLATLQSTTQHSDHDHSNRQQPNGHSDFQHVADHHHSHYHPHSDRPHSNHQQHYDDELDEGKVKMAQFFSDLRANITGESPKGLHELLALLPEALSEIEKLEANKKHIESYNTELEASNTTVTQSNY